MFFSNNHSFYTLQMKSILFILSILLASAFRLAGQVVFPSPEKTLPTTGSLEWEQKVISIHVPDTGATWLHLLRTTVFKDSSVQFCSSTGDADVRFITDERISADSYRLHITPRFIEIRAAGKGGFIYAIQTLRQWVKHNGKKLVFDCVDITDSPRLSWRGFMLDSGRQYQRLATIKKYIDMASLLKMNYFHWHLTEGLGWRIDIKQYPLLTRTGAFIGPDKEQQGFYTQEEIRELVAYATERNVTIVPEIDMPGHAEAALIAYPSLGCFNEHIEVPRQGFTAHIFCAGKDSTLRFLKNVLDEVCDLFPSPYIHLGGDEAPKDNWNKCPDCRQKIIELGLKDSEELQLWFSAEMAAYLQGKGKKAIFWGDVVRGGDYPLPSNVIIQWWNWRGAKDRALQEARRRNLPVICNTNYYTYLNFPLHPWKGYEEDRTFDLKDVYLHNPSYRPNDNRLIMGMNSSIWTDFNVTEDMIDERLFPRILALAEQMWYKGKLKDFDAFYHDVKEKRSWFEAQGFTFGPALKTDKQTH